MKKVIYTFIVVVCGGLVLFNICFWLLGCEFSGFKIYNYSKWKTIDIEDAGKIKIPQKWACFVENDKMYIVDENEEPVMIETFSYAGIYEWDIGIEDENKYYSEIINLKYLQSETFANSATYGKTLIKKEGVEEEVYFIELPEKEGAMELLVIDPKLSLKDIKKIAYSFEMK